MFLQTSSTYYLLKCSLVVITVLGIRKSVADIISNLSRDVIQLNWLLLSLLRALAKFAGLYGALYESWQPLLAFAVFMAAVLYTLTRYNEFQGADPTLILIYKMFTIIAFMMVVVYYNVEPEITKPEVKKTNIPVGSFLARNGTYQALKLTNIIITIVNLLIIFISVFKQIGTAAHHVFYGSLAIFGIYGAVCESWKLLFVYVFIIALIEAIVVWRCLQGHNLVSSVVLNSVKLVLALSVAGFLYNFEGVFPAGVLESVLIYRHEVHNNFSKI